jgi:4-amino-4-deoxy-L-arabinose transferase-like glycosyltransferase
VTDERAPDQLERALKLVLLLLIAYRVAYHATYLGEIPFAHATFSDGAVYEAAARDILEHPPLGSEAFYLQGAYAYLLAIGMSIRPWASLGLLVQLLVAFATLLLFHRCAIHLWSRRAGLMCSIALLAHPGLLFYENKYVSAELGIACNVLALAGFVALLRAHADPTRARTRLLACLALGFASGLAILARPNLVLALPCTLLAILALTRSDSANHPRNWRALSLALTTTALGLLLALAPMAARNLAVTGYPDIGPVHAGGTSFFIGNNPKSKGVWNDGDLLSANLGTESEELTQALEIDETLPDRDRARAIGDALYQRSLAWIAQNPGAWLKLELRKLWLTAGDQQLTQDYDWLGERELIPWAHRIGVSFSLLLALALLGAGGVFGQRWRPHERDPDPPAYPRTPAARRALAWFLVGQIGAPLAANLLFFTSAQHRLPLVIPLALLAGPGLLALLDDIRRRFAKTETTLPTWLLLAALLALAQGPWPRTRADGPHPVHYYNLALAQDSIGEPRDALATLDRAIELRPDHVIFHLRRAHLRVRLQDFAGAAEDLSVIDRLAANHSVPDWVLREAELDRATLRHEQSLTDRPSTQPLQRP